VAVIAAAAVSPLGKNLAQTLASLREGRDCVSLVTRFDVSKTRCSTAGQVPDEFLAEVANENRKTKRLHRASHMMIAATRAAFAQAPGFAPELAVIGTTSGGMTFGEAFFRSVLNRDPQKKRATWLANYSPQKQVLDALDSVGICAPMQIIANACASGTNAIGHAFQLILSGKKNRVLCGGFDAISELVFVGFDSLQASTPEKIRPFDKDRTGLVLGEGAAILALESWDDAVARGAEILAEITGYGISTDNHHLTQPHPSGIGPLQAMSRALESASRSPGDVDYINAHGTATIFNDATEGAAITQLFNRAVPVSSTKSMMGHSLGAAGAIEAVISILALRHQFLPPNINLREADPAWNFEVVKKSRHAKIGCAISNSFGFGGTNATIVLEVARETRELR
jgi:3-oxoacyl-[acyl-carrier-protein] synthase II